MLIKLAENVKDLSEKECEGFRMQEESENTASYGLVGITVLYFVKL